jgi:hypothetical protein
MNVSRRDFVRFAAGGALAAVAAPGELFARGAAAEPSEPRRNVGIYSARGGTMGGLVNRDGIAVVGSRFPDTLSTFYNGRSAGTAWEGGWNCVGGRLSGAMC